MAFLGLVAALFYALAAKEMLNGAVNTAGYLSNGGVETVITLTGAAITAFVAAQIGVVVATPGGNPIERLKVRSFGANNDDAGETAAAWMTIVVLLVDFAVLVVAGYFFVRLFMSPSRVAVAPGASALKEAPDYIALQAKALLALVPLEPRV
jgi:hypothetical protein